MSELLVSRLRDERGSVIVTAGVMVLAFLLLGAVVIEVGQWFEHRRAIQSRSDASVLAGGQLLAQCFNIGINGVTEATVDSQIEGWAKSYAGLSGGASTQTGAPYNHQFGKSSSNLMSFQSSTYPSAGIPQPTQDLGHECYKDGDSTNTAASNLNLMLDGKLTQAGIPPLFSISPFATVHGHARVQLQEVQSLIPSMPLAVPDVEPQSVAVTFVDVSTGQALSNCTDSSVSGSCVFPLTGPTQTPSSGQPVPSTGYLNAWGANVTIPVPAANTNIGMRVGIGANVGSCAGVSEVHTNSANYVCYDYSSGGNASNRGVVQLRSYDPGTGSITNPILGAVTPTTCSGVAGGGSPFFSYYEAGQLSTYTGSCPAYVTANVDFGTGATLADEQIRGALTGSSGGSTALTFTNTGGDTWTAGPVDLSLYQGPYDVTLQWKYGTGGGNWNNFNAGNPVQQIFSGSDGTDATLPGGPIFSASVDYIPSCQQNQPPNFCPANPTYSIPTSSTTANFNVTVGLTGGVHLPVRCSPSNQGASYKCSGDPPVLLRLSTGSQTYAVNCGTIPGNGNGPDLLQQIEYGCADAYSLNAADICPDPAAPTPPDCADIANATGVKVGQVQKAMDQRFTMVDPTTGNTVCDPNNYPTPGSLENPPTVSPTDPRAVTLIVTDFSAFTGNGGNTTVPVITFATFYVTGWDHQSNFTLCNTQNGPPPAQYSANGNSAAIWGHFIAATTLKGKPSGETCKGESTPCVPALVR